jgi:hypothetical protein
MPTVDIPMEHLKKFTGRYASGEGAETRIALDGRNLVAIMITEDE